FFFQAEDGIRDRNVTGVQTCALPISDRPRHRWCPWTGFTTLAPSRRKERTRWEPSPRAPPVTRTICRSMGRAVSTEDIGYLSARSEERRVGKGCTRQRATTETRETRG